MAKWLVNELFLSFYAIKKCVKAQSNPIIFFESYCVYRRQTDRHTDTDVKDIFPNSMGLKIWRFDENWKSYFSHKTNTFSYDENVKKEEFGNIIGKFLPQRQLVMRRNSFVTPEAIGQWSYTYVWRIACKPSFYLNKRSS